MGPHAAGVKQRFARVPPPPIPYTRGLLNYPSPVYADQIGLLPAGSFLWLEHSCCSSLRYNALRRSSFSTRAVKFERCPFFRAHCRPG